MGLDRLTLFFNFVASVLGESSPIPVVAVSVSLSGDDCLVLAAGFAFLLKMIGVEAIG